MMDQKGIHFKKNGTEGVLFNHTTCIPIVGNPLQ